MAIFESLYVEAEALGVWRGKDPMDGIESRMELARVPNSCTSNS